MRMNALSKVASKRLRPCANIKDRASCGRVEAPGQRWVAQAIKSIHQGHDAGQGVHALARQLAGEATAVSVLMVLGDDCQGAAALSPMPCAMPTPFGDVQLVGRQLLGIESIGSGPKAGF